MSTNADRLEIDFNDRATTSTSAPVESPVESECGQPGRLTGARSVPDAVPGVGAGDPGGPSDHGRGRSWSSRSSAGVRRVS